MKKKTVITTETREVWVIRQPFWAVDQPAAEHSESEPYSSESLTLHTNHDAKDDNDSSAESTTPDVPE